MPKYNKYNMHHQWMHGFFIGNLTPVFNQEVTPGDIWGGKSTCVFRLGPLVLPTFITLKMYVKFFFVPHRLTWPEFPEVITGADTSTAWPTITYNPVGTVWRYFGVGTQLTSTPALNALPVRAFNQVYNDRFLNELIETPRSLDLITSLPRVRFPSSDYYGGIQTEIQQGNEEIVEVQTGTPDFINTTEIRDAFNRQRFKERRARYGERYEDLLLSDYGIKPSDARINKAEYVGGGSATMGISEVVATATSTGETTGEFKGHGITGMTVRMKPRRFTEHGRLVGVAYARPRLQLDTKIDRDWWVNDKDDLYHPHLASDTQVTVNTGEIYCDTATPTANFGYQFRDEWLRGARDVIAGAIGTSGNAEWCAPVELSSVPTVSFLQQVQDYNTLFQVPQASGGLDIAALLDHKINKLSYIKRRPR